MEVLYTWKQNICLLLYNIFLFHFHLLKKNMPYTFSQCFFLVVPSFTYCALATTFIILLKFFIRFQRPLLCRIQWPTESSRSSSFLLWPPYILKHCVIVVFPIASGMGCAICLCFWAFAQVVFYQEWVPVLSIL